jgi:hypothetical protein
LQRPPIEAPAESGAVATAALMRGRDGAIAPPDPYALAATLGNRFSHRSAATVRDATPALRAALILGSPEFMMH